MEPIQDYIPVTKAKAALLDLVRRVKETDDAIAITKNGKPEAVLMSMRRFQGLLETIDIISDEEVMASLRRSIREAREEKWQSPEEVFGDETA